MEAIKLKPVFDDLNSPDAIINHIKQLKQSTAKEKELKANPFPVEVFPLPIKEIIKAKNESLNFPIHFIGDSMLYAFSVAIVNTHKIEIIIYRQVKANIYLSFVEVA